MVTQPAKVFGTSKLSPYYSLKNVTVDLLRYGLWFITSICLKKIKPLRIWGIINISFMNKDDNNTKFTVTSGVLKPRRAANRAKEALIRPPRARGSWLIYVMMIYFLTCLITPRFQRRTLQLGWGSICERALACVTGWKEASSLVWRICCDVADTLFSRPIFGGVLQRANSVMDSLANEKPMGRWGEAQEETKGHLNKMHNPDKGNTKQRDINVLYDMVVSKGEMEPVLLLCL